MPDEHTEQDRGATMGWIGRVAMAAVAVAMLSACSGSTEVTDTAPVVEAESTDSLEVPEPATPTPDRTTARPTPTRTTAAPELGTRANPAQPEQHTMTVTESGTPTWEVTVGPADFDAWPAIKAENQFNDPPDDGSVYVMLPVTVTYVGEESGLPWVDIDVSFVTADGRSFVEASEVIPDALRDIATLYPGGKATGNMAFMVPADAAAGGTWAVSHTFGDPMFFAAI